jgi:putative FmdB family regulatory protein
LKIRHDRFISFQFIIKTMPTYEYVCNHCGEEHEAFQRMSEDPLVTCPACAQPALKRKIGLGAGIIFKGGGFYETDFKDRKGAKSEDGGSAKKEESSKSAGDGASTKSEAKSDSTAKPASTAASG